MSRTVPHNMTWMQLRIGLLVLLDLLIAGCHEPQHRHTSTESEGTPTPPPSFSNVDQPRQRWFHLLEDIDIRDLRAAPDGSVYLAGTSRYFVKGGDGGYMDALWIARANMDGRLLWTKEYLIENPNDHSMIISAMDADESGVRMNRLNFGPDSDTNNMMIRLDQHGNPLGNEFFFPGQVNALLAISASTTIAAGNHFDYPDRKGVGWIAAIDEQGNTLWHVEIIDPDFVASGVHTIASGPNDVLYVGGGLQVSPSSSLSAPWIAKLDVHGNLLWHRKLAKAAGTSQVYELAWTDDHDELVVFASGPETFMARLSEDGQEIERRTINDGINSSFAAIAPSGNYIRTDGEYYESNNYQSCWHPSVICPDALRVGQFERDGTPLWFQKREDCRAGIRSAYGADGTVWVLASCNSDGQTGMGTGLIGFAP